MADVLVLGYGNELRGDDALGPFVAGAVGAAGLPGVRVRTAGQLLPEFAADVSGAGLVVFVDAAGAWEEGVCLRPLEPSIDTEWNTHFSDPRALLALARQVFGRAPPAWWLTVPGADFGFGAGLSAVGRENARQAIDLLFGFLSEATTRPPVSR